MNQGYDFHSDPIPGLSPLDGSLLSKTCLLGGGNFIMVVPTAGTINPVVGNVNGVINANYSAGILASLALLQQNTLLGVSANNFLLVLRVQDLNLLTPVNGRGVAAPSCDRNNVRAGYVDRGDLVLPTEGRIGRAEVRDIIGKSAQTNVQEHTKELGVLGLILQEVAGAPRPIEQAIELGA